METLNFLLVVLCILQVSGKPAAKDQKDDGDKADISIQSFQANNAIQCNKAQYSMFSNFAMQAFNSKYTNFAMNTKHASMAVNAKRAGKASRVEKAKYAMYARHAGAAKNVITWKEWKPSHMPKIPYTHVMREEHFNMVYDRHHKPCDPSTASCETRDKAYRASVSATAFHCNYSIYAIVSRSAANTDYSKMAMNALSSEYSRNAMFALHARSAHYADYAEVAMHADYATFAIEIDDKTGPTKRPYPESTHGPNKSWSTRNPGTMNPETMNPGTMNPATAPPATANPATMNPWTENPGTTQTPTGTDGLEMKDLDDEIEKLFEDEKF